MINGITDVSYTGYKEIYMNDIEMTSFYENSLSNKYNCLINEYLILCDKNGVALDYYRWTGMQFVRIVSKTIDSNFVGRIKARNSQQVLAIDLLQNPDITVKVLSGKAGSGKSMLMIHSALNLITKGKFDKIVYVRNNIEVKDSRPLGALPGGVNDKLQPFFMPLADHIGEACMWNGKVEFIHLGYMRGRDIKNSIVIVNEAENLTCAHVGLLISRISENSQLWLDGDFKQVDMKAFESNNGLLAAIERLKGNPLFGYVKLLKNERSATASLAELFD